MFNGPTYNHNYYLWGTPPAYWSPLPAAPIYYPPVVAARPVPTYTRPSPVASPQVINQYFEGPVENHFYESSAAAPMYAPPAPKYPVYIPPRRPKTPRISPALVALPLPAPSVYNLSPNTQAIMGTPYTGVNICNGCDGRQYCALHNPWASPARIPADDEDDDGGVLLTPGIYCVPSPWMTPRTPARKMGRQY
ncbi:unnamed protein product [Peniophora sp. CBMAI 1063]|nr:unnamed protein product [Peniophora sp. CBMAI 1063]